MTPDGRILTKVVSADQTRTSDLQIVKLNVGIQPHQFHTRNSPNKSQQTRSKANETAAKATKLIDMLPLKTLWSQVERFLNRQLDQSCFGSEH
jgi:hypothetical protein